jgi:Flagellin-specific chaperone FliS
MTYPRMNKAISAYATTSSMVPPLVAVVRLYEKAMVHLHLARDAARDRKFDKHFNEINRAIAIFVGLSGVLNDKLGGEVAATLRSFYRSLIAQAGLAAARRDPVAATDAIIRQVSDMLTAWRSIAAERGMDSSILGASAKEPHASAFRTQTDHAQLRVLG